MSISINYFPKEWGIHVRYNGEIIQPLKEGDMEALEWLRGELMEYYGEPVPHKWAIAPIIHKRPGITSVLNRLWQNNIISRFATTFHTISGRPNYSSWWIWDEECDGEQGKGNTPRSNNGPPIYPVPK